MFTFKLRPPQGGRPRSSQEKDSESGSGNSLVVQWLGLYALIAEGLGSIPGQGTKGPRNQVAWPKRKKERKKERKRLARDFSGQP